MEAVNVKLPNERLDLDDVKKAAPVEADAVTSILASIDENDALAQKTPEIIKGVEPGKSAIVLDNTTQEKSVSPSSPRNNLHEITKKLQEVHGQASVIKSEQEGDSKSPNNKSVETAGIDDTTKSAGVSDTTSKLLQTANVLVNLHRRTKEKKESSEGENDIETGESDGSGRLHPKKSDSKDPPSTKRGMYKDVIEDVEELYRVLQPERRSIKRMLRYATVIILIFFLVAVLTFYTVKEANIFCVTKANNEERVCTTISWTFLFLIRQIITFIIAVLIQHVIIDVMCLHFQCLQRLLGPLVILGIIQSKGWPFIVSAWAIMDFILLYGPQLWKKHWLYWQDIWGLFNEDNPAGHVTESTDYRNILLGLLFLGIATSLKRIVFGLTFGKKTFGKFAKKIS